MTNSITLIAPAKLNLNLNVKNKLKNGYHSLESDVCFLDLYDMINIEISNLDKITISDKSTFVLKDESILSKTLKCFNDEFKRTNIDIEIGNSRQKKRRVHNLVTEIMLFEQIENVLNVTNRISSCKTNDRSQCDPETSLRIS